MDREQKLLRASWILVIFFSSACGKLPGYEVLNKQDGFTVEATTNPDIDMLFVIDNSASMENDQATVINSFQEFIDQFSSKGLHFRIGIISTDQYGNLSDTITTGSGTALLQTNNPSQTLIDSWWDPLAPPTNRYRVANLQTTALEPIYNKKFGSLLSKTSGLKFISWDTSDFSGKFRNNANLGVLGSPAEMPMMSTITALRIAAITPPAWNSGFLRTGAFLSVIMLTDEDETMQVNVLGNGDLQYVHNSANVLEETSRINKFLATLTAIKGNNLDNFSLNVIAAPENDADCNHYATARAITFKKLIDKINTNYPAQGNGDPKAKLVSICNPVGFGGDLVKIGSDIIEANAKYPLAQPPADQTQIKVFVNSVEIARNSSNGWDYNIAGQFVQFYGTAVPAIGDHVVVDYVPGTPI